MSLAGFDTFAKNLEKLMDSPAFKQATEDEQLQAGYRLLRSKYGVGSFMGIGKVKALPDADGGVQAGTNRTTSGAIGQP